MLARRDDSANNVPVVGYNEAVDAQDVILFGVRSYSETLTTSGSGYVTLSKRPVSLEAVVNYDDDSVPRERSYQDEITVKSGSTTYYAGDLDVENLTLKIYTTSSRSTVAAGVSVTITYYVRVPLTINSSGQLVVTTSSASSVSVSNFPSSLEVSNFPDEQSVNIISPMEDTKGGVLAGNYPVKYNAYNDTLTPFSEADAVFNESGLELAAGDSQIEVSGTRRYQLHKVIFSHDGSEAQRFIVALGSGLSSIAGTSATTGYFWVPAQTTVVIDFEGLIVTGSSGGVVQVVAHSENSETVNVDYKLFVTRLS